MRPWTVNYFGALGGNGTTALLATPAQHRAQDVALGTSTLRLYNELDVRLFYSGNLAAPSTSDAPTIVSVIALPNSSNGVTFTAQVVGDPKAAIHQVWVTYFSDGVNQWQPQDLTQCVAVSPTCPVADSTKWTGTLPSIPSGLRYIVQAVNGYGLVTLDDNMGVYYGLGGSSQQPTTTTLVTAPTNGIFGQTQTLKVNLTSGGTQLIGKNVIVAIAGVARVGTTADDGQGNAVATIDIPLNSLPGTYRVVASFGGDANYLGSSASGGTISIGQAPTSLAALSLSSGVSTLTGTIGSKTTPLMQEAVTFVVSNGSTSKTIVAITDYLGQAFLPPTGLPAGIYNVTASFAGNATFLPASTSSSLTIVQQDINFGGNFATSLPYPGSFSFTVTSTPNSVPVTVPLVSGSPCTLSYSGGVYTLMSTGTGTCTISASAPGALTFTPVTKTQAVTVKMPQTVTFSPAPPPSAMYNSTFTVGATSTSGSVTITASGGCTIASPTVTMTSGTTSCNLLASAPETTSYLAASATATVTATKATPTIAFVPTPLPNKTFGDADFTVSATTTGGGTVSFAASGSCTLSGSTVHLTGGGSCTITASVPGDNNYKSASLDALFTIAKAIQTITFTLTDKYLDQSPVTLAATASSGLPVSYAATGVCTVTGDATNGYKLTLTAVGSCTVTASQGGNASYNAAPDSSQTILIHLPNLWKPTNGSMTMPRSYHTATRLNDGRVLITGGNDQFGSPTASTELFDPASRTFSSAGNMPSKSANHAAVLLNDGRVAVFGGGNSSSQVYTPSTNTWASGGGMGSNRSYHTATTLQPSGKVLIVGGADNAGKTQNTTIVYDPVNGGFTPGPTMDTARERHTATLLTLGPNAGKVLIVGGRSRNGNGNSFTTYATYQICDANACTASQPGPAKRYSHAALEITIPTTPVDKDVLVTGGNDGNNDLATSDLYSFDTATSTWKWTTVSPYTLPQNMVPKRELAVAELPFGQAIAAGGFNGTAVQSAADIYAPPMSFAPPMGVKRAGHTATTLRDSNRAIIGVLVTGGVSTGNVSVNSAETYGMP
jgi:hypothetical protein